MEFRAFIAEKPDGKRKTTDEKALEIMNERFGRDSLLSVAALDGNRPSVSIVNL